MRKASSSFAAALVMVVVVVFCLAQSPALAQQAGSFAALVSAQCGGTPSRDCDVVVPSGTAVEIAGDAEVASLVVRGSLVWNPTQRSVLHAGFVVAEGPNGLIEVGTESNPAPEGSGVYIRDNGRQHEALGKRSFGSWKQGAAFHVHGRPLQRTWDLLSRHAWPGESEVQLEHSPQESGWRVGDRVVLAPTASYPKFKHDSKAETFTVVGMEGNVLRLDRALTQPRAGSAVRRVQAEIINLSRSVLITGDGFDGQGHGLHVVAHSGGVGVVKYARVTKGGQHGLAGKYPLHFHMAGDCPGCQFVGNAIEESSQRGIIVHGTHRCLVSENVLYDIMGSYIYVEDGNELENVISYNVAICPIKNGCKVGGTDNNQADDLQQSGLWALSVSNDFIGNRLVNMYNGFFTQTSAFPHGRGAAAGRVCTMYAPFGKISGNVCHSNERFGFYLDNNFPRKLRRSVQSNGLLDPADFHAHVDGNPRTFSSCDAFTEAGEDNGVSAIVEDQLEIGNSFSGQYALGDVQFLRWHAINNLHGIYWKETKAMASTGIVAHIKDSVFEWISSWDDSEIRGILGSPEVGVAAIAGPGGLGAFIIENTAFKGHLGDAIAANQHCGLTGTGGLCTPEYQLAQIDWSGVNPDTRRIRFGISNGNDVLPIFSTFDDSLGGYVSVASSRQDHLLGLPGCHSTGDRALDNGIGCDVPLRRLQVWSSHGNQGAVLVAPGGRRWAMEFIGPPTNNNRKQAFGAAVAVGESYVVELSHPDGITLEFSDVVYGTDFPGEDWIDLEIRFRDRPEANRACRISSGHSRAFISSDGPLFDDGSLGACTAATASSPSDEPPSSPSDEPPSSPPDEPLSSPPPQDDPSVPSTDAEMVCEGRTAEERALAASCDEMLFSNSPNPFTGEGYYTVDSRCLDTSIVGCVGDSGCRLCHTEPETWGGSSSFPKCPQCVCDKWGETFPGACLEQAAKAVEGCMDASAENFNEAATVDDGSCVHQAPSSFFDGFQWRTYVNRFAGDSVSGWQWRDWYGNWPASSDGPEMSRLVTRDSGSYLDFWSRYEDPEAWRMLIETSIYRPMAVGSDLITADQVGTYHFDFTAHELAEEEWRCGWTNPQNGVGGGKCEAFAKVVDSTTFELLLFERLETTGAAQSGTPFSLEFELQPAHVGHLIQIGFMNSQVGYAPTGMLYSAASLTRVANNEQPSVLGCTDAGADNHDQAANVDDGSCVFCNAATEVFEDGECTCRPGFGDFGSGCVARVAGCTNPDAGNFNSQANVDDGSCMCSCSCSLF